MNSTKRLHILNGQVMFETFKRTGFLEGEWMIPFNEAMCVGEVSADIFSSEFNKIRSTVHGVTQKQYEEITLKPLQSLFNRECTHLELWFDSDMFCQMNVVTILAWIDQANHQCSINLHIVDDQFKPIENYTLLAEGYSAIYHQVFLHKTMPPSIDLPFLKRGIELYLTYQNEMMAYIQKHVEVPENELVLYLLDQFKEYGLGDTQYLELIKMSRSKGE